MSRADKPFVATPHAFLRETTRAWHDRVEAAYARFAIETVEGLSGFLRQQAMAFLPLESELERSGVDRLVPHWPDRRRGAALGADLAQLGSALPVLPPAPSLPSGLHMLGALYVLEGSRLGGRFLHRRIASSPDPRVRAAHRFLGHRHDSGWPSFLAVLNEVSATEPALAALREGACSAFALFVATPTRGHHGAFAGPSGSSLVHSPRA